MTNERIIKVTGKGNEIFKQSIKIPRPTIYKVMFYKSPKWYT